MIVTDITDMDKKRNIDRRHAQNLFKLRLMPAFVPEGMNDGT